jgi:hypothetical protein
MRSTFALCITASVCALLAACSSSKTGSGDSTAPVSEPAQASSPAGPSTPAAGTSGSSDAAPASGACQYLTVDQASDLAQSPVRAGVERSLSSGPVTFDYCDYIFDPGNAPGVTVAIAHLSGDPQALFDEFRQSKQSDSDFQDVAGVGDAAFYADQNLNILAGDTGVIIYVGRANGTPRGPAGIPDEKAAADIILPQL